MAGELTARDRVWAGVLKTRAGRFTIEDVKRHIRKDDEDDLPNEETIRRVLRAATDLDILNHREGSRYYQKEAYLRGHFDIDL